MAAGEGAAKNFDVRSAEDCVKPDAASYTGLISDVHKVFWSVDLMGSNANHASYIPRSAFGHVMHSPACTPQVPFVNVYDDNGACGVPVANKDWLVAG